jgi:hypothetical protein
VTPRLLARALPDFAERVEAALREQGEDELAARFAELELVAACRCEVPACGSFYTAPTPIKRWFRRGRQVEVAGLPGSVVLDVVGGEIVYVEVLSWDEVRDAVAVAAS